MRELAREGLCRGGDAFDVREDCHLALRERASAPLRELVDGALREGLVEPIAQVLECGAIRDRRGEELHQQRELGAESRGAGELLRHIQASEVPK